MVVKNVEKKEHNSVSFVIEVGSEEFENAVNRAYQKNKNEINVPGFRKGKASRMVIEGMFGKNFFYEDAVNELAPGAFELGANDLSLKAVGKPSLVNVNFGEDKTAELTFETAVYPEVTLGQYKGLEAEKTKVEVKDSEIDEELERIRQRNARLETVSRPSVSGDEVTIDYKGFIDGVAFEGGEDNGHKLVLGSGQFIPGFEDQVIGMSAGEEKDIDVTFPENYHGELAGKSAVFHVTVNEVRESQVDELDDEFAKDVSEFDTLEEYKASIRKNLEEAREKESTQGFRDNLLNLAAENMTVEIPEAMVDEKVDFMMREFDQNLSQQGLSMEQYLGYIGTDLTRFAHSARPSALRRVKIDILLDEVGDAEKFEISDEEIDAEYQKISEQFNIDMEIVLANMPRPYIIQDLKNTKAAECIYNSGIPKEPEEKADEKKADEEKAPEKKKRASKKTEEKQEAGETVEKDEKKVGEDENPEKS